MRSLRGLLAVSGHLVGRHAPPSSASSSPHSVLFARALQILSQPDPVRLHKLSAPDSGIVELRLKRPEARNAVGKEMLKELRSAMDKVEADPTANVVLVASSVPKVFCAGADLKERRLMGPCEVREFVNTLRATFSSFEALPIPTIAVVEGAAFGGGLELALSCDLRICGESATFSLPETGLAIIPGAGGTQRLPRIVGRARAKELIFTGRRFDATEAVNMGVVNYCVPGGEAYQKALELAREINQKGPLAIRMAKKAINEGMEVDLSSALTVEEECYEQVLHTQDRLEGLAAFAEKRKPLYTGKGPHSCNCKVVQRINKRRAELPEQARRPKPSTCRTQSRPVCHACKPAMMSIERQEHKAYHASQGRLPLACQVVIVVGAKPKRPDIISSMVQMRPPKTRAWTPATFPDTAIPMPYMAREQQQEKPCGCPSCQELARKSGPDALPCPALPINWGR